MKRTTTKALTVATTLAVAGAVAAAGTLSASTVASPDVEAAAYTVSNATYANTNALAARTDVRETFAERASRAADREARLKKIRAAKVKAAKAKAARIATKKALAKKLAASKRKAVLTTRPVTSGSARAIGKQMAANRGWTGSQWAALDKLWTAESGWRTTAGNGSGAYGIPQALPGSRMAAAGANWRTSASTQIEWGLDYIDSRWGSPMNAYGHFLRAHWY